MARVVILGAGISGHTAALHLRRQLKGEHRVTVVSPNANWNWIPSNIWVGVGKMTSKQVTFPLAPIYKRKGIDHVQAKAVAIRPEGDANSARGLVDIVYTDTERAGTSAQVDYDYLIVATGPKLNFAATPGLGPEANSLSVCTPGHAEQASAAFDAVVDALREGKRQTLVIGVGHGTCTCEGAAFEYTFNVDHELRERGVRDLADVVYLSNEFDLGDFGVGGMTFAQNGFETSSKLWTESLFRERGVRAILRAHVERVDEGVLHYELLDGTKDSLAFNFAMLLPPFRGADVQAFDREGTEITAELFAPNGFLKVDANYEQRPLRGVDRRGLAEDLPVPEVRQRLRGGHRVRAAARDLGAPQEPKRHRDLARPAAHRHAVGRDGTCRRALDRRSDQPWGVRAARHRVDGRDGSGLHRVGGNGHAQGDRRCDDDVPDRPGPQALSALGS